MGKVAMEFMSTSCNILLKKSPGIRLVYIR